MNILILPCTGSLELISSNDFQLFCESSAPNNKWKVFFHPQSWYPLALCAFVNIVFICLPRYFVYSGLKGVFFRNGDNMLHIVLLATPRCLTAQPQVTKGQPHIFMQGSCCYLPVCLFSWNEECQYLCWDSCLFSVPTANVHTVWFSSRRPDELDPGHSFHVNLIGPRNTKCFTRTTASFIWRCSSDGWLAVPNMLKIWFPGRCNIIHRSAYEKTLHPWC